MEITTYLESTRVVMLGTVINASKHKVGKTVLEELFLLSLAFSRIFLLFPTIRIQIIGK